jgi:maltose phosphorylase
MRIKNNTLSFAPKIPKQWEGYSFKINFRDQIVKVSVTQNKTIFGLEGTKDLEILVNGKTVAISPNQLATI